MITKYFRAVEEIWQRLTTNQAITKNIIWIYGYYNGTALLTWININLSIDITIHPLQNADWNYKSIANCWELSIDK